MGQSYRFRDAVAGGFDAARFGFASLAAGGLAIASGLMLGA